MDLNTAFKCNQNIQLQIGLKKNISLNEIRNYYLEMLLKKYYFIIEWKYLIFNSIKINNLKLNKKIQRNDIWNIYFKTVLKTIYFQTLF